MAQKLVSILTPCYNTASFIHRLLDSILSQTYQNLEMILVNDGSTDNLLDIVEGYKKKFEERGIPFLILNQENSGQSVAIKNGLQYVKGDYLVWPDSDDFYASPLAIEKMVNTLENVGNEYAMVRTQEKLLDEHTLTAKQIWKENTIYTSAKDLFEDCLFVRNGFYYAPGAYMVDFQKFKGLTSLDIYTEKNAGQNWQLMLPILYNYKCITINEPLYNVIERFSSHSRNQYHGLRQELSKNTSYENTLLETLKRINGMPSEECSRYSNEIHKKYCYIKLNIAFHYNAPKEFNEIYYECKKYGYLNKSVKLKKIIISVPYLAPILLKIKSLLKY